MKLNKNLFLKRDNYQKIEARKNRLEVLLFLLMIASIFFAGWGILIYRKTIVEPKYLFGAICFGTIITSIILLFVTKQYLNAFWTFFISIIIGGGTIYFLTLFINKKLANQETNSEIFDIEETGTLAKGRRSRCRIPFAIINFNGIEKELIFDCKYENSINTFKKVRLEYSVGFWDFPVIRKQILIP